MTRTLQLSFILAAIFATALLIANISFTRIASASAPSGLPATMQPITAFTASSTPGNIMATSTCNARIVSTTGTSAVMLSFNDQVPTGSAGIWQAASTTVAYDSGQYGCGSVRVYSYASAPITVIDVR